MGREGSGLEFRVNSVSGRVGSLTCGSIGLGPVKKIGPTSNSEGFCIIVCYLFLRLKYLLLEYT